MITSSFYETLYIGRYIEMVKLSESAPIAYEMERRRMHDHICYNFELEKEETRDITDNLDKYDYDPHKVYRELLQRMCIKRGKRK
jgi:hypothetical protein